MAISRIAITVVIVVILIVAGGVSVYLVAARPSSTATTTTSTTSTTMPTTTTSPATATSTTQSTSSTSSSSLSSQSSTTTTSSGNLVVDFPTTTVPAAIYDTASQEWAQDLIYESLFSYNETGSSAVPIPWLASGYTVNPTAQVWTINLRQGVTFTDGTQFNATTVKDNVDELVIADNTGLDFFVCACIRGATTYLASNHNAANQTILDNSDGITVLGPYSLQFNLTHPEADFLSYIAGAFASNFAVSPTGINANGGITPGVGNTWLQTHSDGTGPYVLQSYNAATGTIVVTANTNWWGISALGLKQPFKQITINVVTNLATAELNVRTGAANLIALPTSNLYDFANKTTWLSQDKLISDVTGANLFGPYLASGNDILAMNYNIHTSSGASATVQPFRNIQLVEGIDEAWNATAFIQQDLNGLAVANGGVMLEGTLGYQSFPPPYSYNLTQAKLNIQAACVQLGCSPSNPLQITFTGPTSTPEELAGSLLTSTVDSLQAGVSINFEPLASSALFPVVLSGTDGMTIFTSGYQSPDPLDDLSIYGTTNGFAAAHFGVSNSTGYGPINAMISQAAATSNATQREQYYVQIDKAIAATGNFESIGQFDDVFATSSNIQISNFNPALLDSFPPIFAISG